jgi:hypothetical protein
MPNTWDNNDMPLAAEGKYKADNHELPERENPALHVRGFSSQPRLKHVDLSTKTTIIHTIRAR